MSWVEFKNNTVKIDVNQNVLFCPVKDNMLVETLINSIVLCL